MVLNDRHTVGDEPGGAVISHRDVTDHRSAEEINQFKLRLNDAIHSLIDADEIAATYARMLAEQLRADRCVYAEIDADGDHFVISGEYTDGTVRSIVGRYAMSDFGAKLLRLMHAASRMSYRMSTTIRASPVPIFLLIGRPMCGP